MHYSSTRSSSKSLALGSTATLAIRFNFSVPSFRPLPPLPSSAIQLSSNLTTTPRSSAPMTQPFIPLRIDQIGNGDGGKKPKSKGKKISKRQKKRNAQDTHYPRAFNLYNRARYEHNGIQPNFALKTSRRGFRWKNKVRWSIENKFMHRVILQHGSSPHNPVRAVLTIRDSAGAPMSEGYQRFVAHMEHRLAPLDQDSEVREYWLLSSKGTFGFYMKLEPDAHYTSFRWRRCSPLESQKITGTWNGPAWKLIQEPLRGDFEVGRAEDIVAIGDCRRAGSKRGCFRFLWESKSGVYDDPWATPAVMSWLALYTWWWGMSAWMFWEPQVYPEKRWNFERRQYVRVWKRESERRQGRVAWRSAEKWEYRSK